MGRVWRRGARSPQVQNHSSRFILTVQHDKIAAMTRKKNPAAVALGKRSAAGRMRKMSPEQRKAVAKKAARARWAKKGKQ